MGDKIETAGKVIDLMAALKSSLKAETARLQQEADSLPCAECARLTAELAAVRKEREAVRAVEEWTAHTPEYSRSIITPGYWRRPIVWQANQWDAGKSPEVIAEADSLLALGRALIARSEAPADA